MKLNRYISLCKRCHYMLGMCSDFKDASESDKGTLHFSFVDSTTKWHTGRSTFIYGLHLDICMPLRNSSQEEMKKSHIIKQYIISKSK